jgi:glycosyltransferase involved in cell wall biosynthesis
VLAVSSTLEHAGFNQRVAMFVEPLKAHGYDVSVVKYPERLGRRALAASLDGYDLVWLRRKTLDWLSARLFRRAKTPIVYDFDDAVYIRSRAKGGSWESRTRTRRFQRTLDVASAVFAGSEYLAAAARRFHDRVRVVPTGVDVRRYTEADHGDQELVRLIWIGTRSTMEYLEDRHALFRRLGEKYPRLRLRIVCNVFPEWTDVPLEKVPWSSESESRMLAESDIGVSPIPDTPFGRGKCGYKLIQYMAAGLPVVTTPVGSHREIVEAGSSGMLALTDDEWFDAVSKLVERPELRRSLGHRGREIVRERYDSTVLTRAIAAVFDDLTG